MPPVDLDTLMSACAGGSSDNKVTCETTADDPPREENFPPESFWLSKDAEFDWFDQNAFYDRTESLKANSNPNSNPNLNPNLNSNSSSQRYSNSVKTKTSYLGLPKTQKTGYIDSRKKGCSKPANVKLFPKRTGSMDKPAVQLPEPSSPKVSCMGRVRSKRKNRKRVEPVQRCRARNGLLKQFVSMFRHDRRAKPVVTEPEPELRPAEFCSRMKVTVQTGSYEPAGLGAMKKFASGRKSSGSTADVAG